MIDRVRFNHTVHTCVASHRKLDRMAKWGEGDPRWIVEERPDATNVNNWHWSDKDASTWSKDKLKVLLIGLVFDGPEGTCQTTEIASVTGEATVNNRKGKLIYFYDWHIKLKWTGTPLDGEKEMSGELEIPNLGEEHDVEDVDVAVTVKDAGLTAAKLKGLVHKTAPGIVREQLAEYIRCLKEEFSQGLIKPIHVQGSAHQREPSPVARPTGRQNSLTANTSASKPSGTGVGYRIPTTKVEMAESFMASAEDLYNALTTQELVEAFTRGKATVEARKGGAYSILGGEITGEFVELERCKRIVQRWRGRSWPAGHHSMVTIDLEQRDDGTMLVLLQKEVPESVLEWTREGWKKYIFEGIKSTFGYGARLL